MDDLEKLKVLDLFSGIGGFSLGLERTGGFETVAFCEIEPYCQKVLKKHWPEVEIYEDVRTLDYRGTVDVICGGYPCQPFSLAGQRQGAEDDRHLWPAMFSLVKKHRPSWVIGENVAGHISMGLDEVLSDLERADYSARAFVIPACAVDAPHRRDRVWVIANSRHSGFQQQGKFGNAVETYGGFSRVFWDGLQGKPQEKTENISKDVADTARKQGDKSDGRVSGEKQRKFGGSCGGLRGVWPTEPNVGRVANGIPKRMDRLRCLGNSVVPQIPEMIGYAILEAHNG